MHMFMKMYNDFTNSQYSKVLPYIPINGFIKSSSGLVSLGVSISAV